MPLFESRIKQALSTRKQQGLTRTITPTIAGNTDTILLNQQSFINFSSNDYLGLADDEALKQSWASAINEYGVGSASSPMVTGHSIAHQQLQQTLCDWLGYEQAVLFNSGFSANQAALFTLLQKDDNLLQDKLNHASLMEAGMLSPAKMQRFAHNDTQRLQRLLHKTGPSLVVTEGVFSMDGDTAPINEINALCQQSGSWLMVDDAHGIGVLGDEGRGSCAAENIHPQLLIVTFGKAIGVQGAAILCDDVTADYLRQYARHFVYSTAMPAAQAVAVSKSIELIRTQQWRRDHLDSLQQHYHQSISHLPGFIETQTPIKPYLAGSSQRAMQLASHLRQQGIWATAIRPPTVAKGKARIRITLSAKHQYQQIDALAQSIEQFELKTVSEDAL
ncbi:8-amino-7-oxononanoate synthase [Vibrio sp. UCD-FRSSP16_10]|uniref:8-amino-7-oxononanoate synthase n=1 Tax=unclassified Vibrio TaxID=2614977 RepID=UPI0007FE0943|nr:MULTISPECIES: 8-amino-7-oxononanoate synthase [unclassified Vibrio]OBT15930.1 8-amino-7-oxononanoate synthase [Vibrio sp. UCD-FRSSP16_10]OBT17824.1 8-amino-7-oxononanoate synthase [Vibrio sp. UCD-FRSSP16_30]